MLVPHHRNPLPWENYIPPPPPPIFRVLVSIDNYKKHQQRKNFSPVFLGDLPETTLQKYPLSRKMGICMQSLVHLRGGWRWGMYQGNRQACYTVRPNKKESERAVIFPLKFKHFFNIIFFVIKFSSSSFI